MFGWRPLRRGGIAATLAIVALLASATGAQAYNHKTQSHWGACSQNTVNVAHAVRDLNANHVLAQYAAMIGVHAKKGKLARAMRRALAVGHVKHAATTANHGCTTSGLIFKVGQRRLHRGETVGVRLPKKYVGRACRHSHKGCKRIVVRRAVVFPTNCWNVNFGHVRAVVWVRPKRKPPTTTPVTVTKVALPAASASLKCLPPSSWGSGTLTVTLSNGAKATLGASFTVTVTGNSAAGWGTRNLGPVAAGKSLTKSIYVNSSGANVVVKVVSGGKTLLSTTYVGGCPHVLPS